MSALAISLHEAAANPTNNVRENVNCHSKQGFCDALGVMKGEADRKELTGQNRERFYAECVEWMRMNLPALSEFGTYVGRLVNRYAFISGGFTRHAWPTNKALADLCTLTKDGVQIISKPAPRTLKDAKAVLFGFGYLIEIPWSSSTKTHGRNVVDPFRILTRHQTGHQTGFGHVTRHVAGDPVLADATSWTDVVALLATYGEPEKKSISAMLADHLERLRKVITFAPQAVCEEPKKKSYTNSGHDNGTLTEAIRPFRDAFDKEVTERIGDAKAPRWTRGHQRNMMEFVSRHGENMAFKSIAQLCKFWREYGHWTVRGSLPNPSVMLHMSNPIIEDIKTGDTPAIHTKKPDRKSRVRASEWNEKDSGKALDPIGWGLD